VKQIFATQIQERDVISEVFLVRDKVTAMARNGKPYLTLKLMDRSGEVEGRIWDRVDELSARFERDDFVRVRGKASVYLGRMQLVVQELEKVADAQVDLADFLPVAERSGDEMLAEVRELVATLESACFRELMEVFLADADFVQHYCQAPAAKAIHHVYLGGLLEHSLAVARLADDICRRYPDVHRDLLLTGALLHDIGKTIELSYARAFGYTDEGKLLGHITIGVQMLDEKLALLPDFPLEQAILLKHLLLSHHGQYEYGSPKRPKTLEATILNYLDDLDSKINGIRTHILREPDNEDAWTGYHRIYDRYFYKSAFAPATCAGRAPGPSEEAEPSKDHAAPAKDRPESSSARPRREARSARKTLGFTLGEQLRGKNLDLFSSSPEESDK
jgi:3'-5' exoribonuclease